MIYRSFLFVVAFAVASMAPAMAQVGSHLNKDRYTKQKPKKANQSFHYFATCMARKYNKNAAIWLSSPDWESSYAEIVSKAKNSGCVRGFADHKFSAHPILIRGGLAEGLFERNWKKSKIAPAFLGLPRIVTADQVNASLERSEKSKLMIMAFNECTAKNAMTTVLDLLKAKPSSDAEQIAFDTLAPTMSGCIPVADGAKISFSKMSLRSGLAEATYKLYELQLAQLSSSAIATSEAQN